MVRTAVTGPGIRSEARVLTGQACAVPDFLPDHSLHESSSYAPSIVRRSLGEKALERRNSLHRVSVVSKLNYLKSSEYGKYPRSEPQQGTGRWLIFSWSWSQDKPSYSRDSVLTPCPSLHTCTRKSFITFTFIPTLSTTVQCPRDI